MNALANRPRVGRLVVPYMVDAERTPIDFKIVDMLHVDRCGKEGRCGICGAKIRRGPIAFIGPRDEQHGHGRNCFADPWMHPECARVAMEQCPFLNQRRGWREGDAHELIATYERNMAMYLAWSWRAHQDARGRWHFAGFAPVEQPQPESPVLVRAEVGPV